MAAEHWTTETERTDGVTIEPWDGGYHIVVPTIGGHARARLCPCCGRSMSTKWAARRAADVVFPIEVQEPQQ